MVFLLPNHFFSSNRIIIFFLFFFFLPSVLVPIMGSLIALQDPSGGSQTITEAFVANNCYVSREQVPLLHTFRTSHNAPVNNRKSLAECSPSWGIENDIHYPLSSYRPGKWPSEVNQRSYSAEQISGEANAGRCLSHPPREAFLRTEIDALDRDSGFSTFPRSITLASVSNWSGDSPRFRRLPKGKNLIY